MRHTTTPQTRRTSNPRKTADLLRRCLGLAGLGAALLAVPPLLAAGGPATLPADGPGQDHATRNRRYIEQNLDVWDGGNPRGLLEGEAMFSADPEMRRRAFLGALGLTTR